MYSVRPQGENIISQLALDLANAGFRSLDALHAAALLESRGWTDKRATEYGFADVFALGASVHARLALEGPEIGRAFPTRQRGAKRWLSVMRSYIRGMTFALPMLLLSMSVVFLHFSIVSYVRYGAALATAIGIGTVASFLVTGGFSQAIAHEGLFYLSQGLYTLGRHFCRRVIAAGFVTVVAFWVVVVAANALFSIFPWWVIGVATIYYFLLAACWLGTSLLYMLRREPSILILFAISIGVVFVLFRFGHFPMMLAQAVAIAIVDIGAFLVANFNFNRLEASEDRSLALTFNRRWSAIIQVARPYFLYGAVYFAFLFADRLVAWSAPAVYHPFVLWLQNEYELGLDWALWTFVLPMGLVEVYVDALFRRIETRRHGMSVNDIPKFNARFVAEHRRTSIWVAVTGILTMIAVIVVLQLLSQFGILRDPLYNPIIFNTFLFAAPSYMLITIALLNSLLPLSLNMVEGALRSAAWGLLVDVVVGFIFSRTLGYQWAVLGLFAGALTFAVLSIYTARAVIQRLDFNLVRLL